MGKKNKSFKFGCGGYIAIIISLILLPFLSSKCTVVLLDDSIKERDFGKAHKYLDKMKSDDYLSERENSFW